MAGAHDDRAALGPVEDLDPTPADDGRRLGAAIDRGPVSSEGRPDAELAAHLPAPAPAAGVDAHSPIPYLRDLEPGLGAAGWAFDRQLGGDGAPGSLVNGGRVAGHVRGGDPRSRERGPQLEGAVGGV